MRRAVNKFMNNNKKTTFILQLTAMVDMFTILIVFLLKSFSTSSVQITPQAGLSLPTSTNSGAPVEAVKLVVSSEGVFVENDKVAVIKDGKLIVSDLDPNDQSFVRPLFERLDQEAKKSREIASINSEHKFDGKIVMQADKNLAFEVLQKVMYTSSMAGYADLNFATISFE